VTEVSSPAPPEPIWPDAIFRLIEQRDRARGVAVALEQENAQLRAYGCVPAQVIPDVAGLLDYHEDDYDVWTDQPEPEDA
jgi:hypothetical protein